MFIGIAGPSCSGKHTIAKYLIEQHGYTLIGLENGRTEKMQENDPLLLPSVDALLQYVTERWRNRFVTCDIDGATVNEFRKRPFFLLLSVDAPVLLRYERCVDRCLKHQESRPSLEEFLKKDDHAMFANEETIREHATLYTIISGADVKIVNSYPDTCQLFELLAKLDLNNPERLRPSWDTYFMHLSDLAARRSNCMKRRVGCILVKDSRVIATGYNGTPRGLPNCNEGGCERCNQAAPCGTGLDRCLCMHAEENALLEAGRSRMEVNSGVVLYCNTCPCLGCAVKIVQQGIKEVVYSRSYGMDDTTARIFAEAKVKLRQHLPPIMRLDNRSDVADDVIPQLGWKG